MNILFDESNLQKKNFLQKKKIFESWYMFFLEMSQKNTKIDITQKS